MRNAKNKFELFLCLLLTVSLMLSMMAPAFAAEGTEGDCAHSNTVTGTVEATCGTEGSETINCSDCGEVISSTPIAATGAHTAGEPVVVAATCGAEGSETINCSDCGAVISSTPIAATGEHTEGDAVVVEATCGIDGSETVSCTVCNAVISSAPIAATGEHTAGEPNVVAASCGIDGSETVSCTVCNAVISSDVIPALGGCVYGEAVVVEATCGVNGSSTKVCTVCGVELVETLLATGEHNYGEFVEIKAPSCLAEGEKAKTCSVCNDIVSETLDMTAHNFQGGVCNNVGCGAKLPAALYFNDQDGAWTAPVKLVLVAADGTQTQLDMTANERGVLVAQPIADSTQSFFFVDSSETPNKSYSYPAADAYDMYVLYEGEVETLDYATWEQMNPLPEMECVCSEKKCPVGTPNADCELCKNSTDLASDCKGKTLPTAICTKGTPITISDYFTAVGSSFSYVTGTERKLQAVVNYEAVETAEQAKYNGYGDYLADFILTFNGISNPAGFVADENCFLAGCYGNYKSGAWVLLPMEGINIVNHKGDFSTSYYVVSRFAPQTYEMICDGVNEFSAAISLSNDMLLKNPNMSVTVSLCIAEVSGTPENPVIGDLNTINAQTFTAAELAAKEIKAGVDGKIYDDVNEAIGAAAAASEKKVDIVQDVQLAGTDAPSVALALANGVELTISGEVSLNSISGDGSTICLEEGAFLKVASALPEGIEFDLGENMVLCCEVDDSGSEYVYRSALAAAMAQIGEEKFASLAEALEYAQTEGITDLTITIIGENTAATTDSFDLVYQTQFDKITLKQADPSKVYYVYDLYTGSRNNGGSFVFDGVNIKITDQYMFEGNVVLSNNSVIDSDAEANCFIYNGQTTIEPGSKITGVIEDLRGGDMIIDGGRTDGAYNTEADFNDAILIVNWSGDSISLKNGAFVNINAASEVGRVTVNSGAAINLSASKLAAWEYIALNAGGELNMDVKSLVETKVVNGAGTVNVDVSALEAGKTVQLIKGNMSSGFTGSVVLENEDSGIVYDVVKNTAGLSISTATAVAKLGDTNYASLEDALDAALNSSNKTVVLLADVNYNGALGEGVTLDLNGKTLTGNAFGTVSINGGKWIAPDGTGTGAMNVIATDGAFSYHSANAVVLYEYPSLALTFISGEIELGDGDPTMDADLGVATLPGQTIIINNGASFTVGADKTFTIRGNVDASNGDVTIENGGIVRLGYDGDQSQIDASKGATLKAASGLNVVSGIDGYVVVYSGGVYQLQEEANASIAATIGKANYASVQDALDAAKDGDTVIISNATGNPVVKGKSITVKFDKNAHIAGDFALGADRGTTSGNTKITISEDDHAKLKGGIKLTNASAEIGNNNITLYHEGFVTAENGKLVIDLNTDDKGVLPVRVNGFEIWIDEDNEHVNDDVVKVNKDGSIELPKTCSVKAVNESGKLGYMVEVYENGKISKDGVLTFDPAVQTGKGYAKAFFTEINEEGKETAYGLLSPLATESSAYELELKFNAKGDLEISCPDTKEKPILDAGNDGKEYLTVTPEKASFYKYGKANLKIECNGFMGALDSVEVISVDGKYYKDITNSGKNVLEIYRGSTIVKLKNAYLKNLELGSYDLKFTYADGQSTTARFSVVKTPLTGDNGFGVFAAAMAISAMGGLAVLAVLKKKGNKA